MQKVYSYIRFSTSEQKHGDSLRRQLEATKEYCNENGLVLDDSLTMQDLGLSAFRGSHKSKGALGEFLKLIEAGKISVGSKLIVENLDRLSREQVMDALQQFTSIINAGVRIITLQDRQEYDKNSISNNIGQLIVSITIMARAHEESKRKSQRLLSAWEQKRRLAQSSNQKVTNRVPSWIKVINKGKQFELILEAAAAIKKIYEMKLDGFGAEKIAIILNQDPNNWKPTSNKRNSSGGWRKSYINKLLWNNRALIGEYQPHRIVLDKNDSRQRRVPIGEAIEDYYPAAIDIVLFQKVQDQIKENRERFPNQSGSSGNGGGRTGKAYNLFSHIIKCGLCGSSMHFIDKGKSSKGGQYLHCDRSRRKMIEGGVCNAKPINYKEFQDLMLKELEELDISKLLPDKKDIESEAEQLNASIAKMRFQVAELERKRNNLIDVLADTNSSNIRVRLRQKIEMFDNEESELCNRIKEQTQTLSVIETKSSMLNNDIDNIQEFARLLKNTQVETEAISLRTKLRKEIQKLLSIIEITPLMDDNFQRNQETDDPDVLIISNSRWLKKIKIKYRHSSKWFILPLQTYLVRKE